MRYGTYAATFPFGSTSHPDSTLVLRRPDTLLFFSPVLPYPHHLHVRAYLDSFFPVSCSFPRQNKTENFDDAKDKEIDEAFQLQLVLMPAFVNNSTVMHKVIFVPNTAVTFQVFLLQHG